MSLGSGRRFWGVRRSSSGLPKIGRSPPENDPGSVSRLKAPRWLRSIFSRTAEEPEVTSSASAGIPLSCDVAGAKHPAADSPLQTAPILEIWEDPHGPPPERILQLPASSSYSRAVASDDQPFTNSADASRQGPVVVETLDTHDLLSEASIPELSANSFSGPTVTGVEYGWADSPSQGVDDIETGQDSTSDSRIGDLEHHVQDYKRKYEQAQTELRSIKAASQLFIPDSTSDSRVGDPDNQATDYNLRRKYEQVPTEIRGVKAAELFFQASKYDKPEDQLPVSSDGGILDMHLTTFLTAIDDLLAASRSNTPTRVLAAAKVVVDGVSAIVDDVRAFEARPPHEHSDVDLDALSGLRERLETTLANLVAAVKTHATSAGLWPVSLLDAAASHVAATIANIGRIIGIRKATRAEHEETSSAHPPASAKNSDETSLWSVEVEAEGRTTPLILNEPAEDSTVAAEDAWAELRPYLEAQTESMGYAIQSVLSGVRQSPPSPVLTDNRTMIIMIISSIVAVCSDNLPPTVVEQGNGILRELTEHANKLNEVQVLPEMTKESRQLMSKSSFAITNALKSLLKL
ncbi:hypothetical protein DFH09DRAFT_432902 [Mycena vulgaris]|nr:hypothetical protein DFH09DRAFT_432902 [Mycena vulgaris]